MMRFAKLQLLLILATLLLVTCKPYGTKGGPKTKYSPDPEDEFELGSGGGGPSQEKRPSEKENKEITFMDPHLDLENNDHLGSHGLGVGKVPHGTKPIGSTSSGNKGVQSVDKDSTLGIKDPSFFKREEFYTAEQSFTGVRDFTLKEKNLTEKDSIDKGLSNEDKDFFPKKEDSAKKDTFDKGSSYGSTDFIPKEKDSPKKDSFDEDKGFIPEEKDFLGKDSFDKAPSLNKGSSYEGKEFISKEKDFPGKDSFDKDSDGGKDSFLGISKVGQDGQNTNKDGIDTSYGNRENSPGRKEDQDSLNNFDKELDNRERPGKNEDVPKGDRNDDPSDDFDSDDEDPGFFENFGSILQGLKKKIESIGDKAGKKAKSTLGYLKESHTEVKEKSHNLWDKIVQNFWEFLGKVDRVAKRGGQYIYLGITDAYDEAKSSQLIGKLAQRLEDGDKVVDQFFKKVGEKVSKWLQQHGHDNVDEGLFAPEKEVEEQFLNPQFPNLFQDIEIHQELDKLVQSGVMQQEEVDQLSIIKKDKKIQVKENPSAPFTADEVEYGVNKAKVLPNVVDLPKGSTEPELPPDVSEQLKSWVNSIDKLVSS